MYPVKLSQLHSLTKQCMLWWQRTRADFQRAYLTVTDPQRRVLLWEDVRERGVCVPALQAHRSAVRLSGAVPGRGGSAQSCLGHRRALLPVPVGVLLPVRGAAPNGGPSVELLLHPHIWYESVCCPFAFWLSSQRFVVLNFVSVLLFGWKGSKWTPVDATWLITLHSRGWNTSFIGKL